MYSSLDLKLLAQATLKLYGYCFKRAAQGFRLTWWASLVPLVALFCLPPLYSITSTIFGFLGPTIVGLILGLVQTLFVAFYLGLIASSVHHEAVKPKELWPLAKGLFWPVMGVFFILWILTLFAGMTFGKGTNNLWLLAVVNGLIVILFNPLPETIYSHRCQVGCNTLDYFSSCLEFMQENVIEWFFPFFVLMLPSLFINPIVLLIWLASAGPMGVWQFSFQSYLLLGQYLSFHWLLGPLIASLLSFYLMVFRGVLYQQLSTSSRRKRIYQMRMD